MKKLSTFAGLLALLLSTSFSASAANYADRVAPVQTIQTCNDNLNVEIINDCRFNDQGNLVGNTNTNSIIGLGRVDFGDGTRIQAVAVDGASGWDDSMGFVVLYAGETLETAQPFTQVAICRTDSYYEFLSYYSPLTCNQGEDPTAWAGGKVADASLNYVVPTGIQNVYLKFFGRAGNVAAVHLFDTLVPADQIAKNSRTHEGVTYEYDYVKAPHQFDGCYDGQIHIAAADFQTIANGGAIDTNNNSWGWTNDNPVLESLGTYDFGRGGWAQVAIEFNHTNDWGNTNQCWMEIYLDEVAENNLVHRFWTGWDIGGRFKFVGHKLDADIRGTHKVYVKWYGGTANLRQVDFYKDMRYLECGDYDLSKINADYQPSDESLHLTFVGDTAHDYEILTNLGSGERIEGNGNIGWTSCGTAFVFKNVDFGENLYDKIIVDAGNDKGYTAAPRSAYYDVYIDLEANGKYTQDQWNNNQDQILAGHTPVARPYLVGTGNWNTRIRTVDDLAAISGVHDLYVIMSGDAPGECRSNLFGIYLQEVGAVAPDPVDVNIPVIAKEFIISPDNPAISFEGSGEFQDKYRILGGTSTDTHIYLGEVDFGNGDLFNAASIELANGWNVDGKSFAILSWAYPGDGFESSMPFAQIAIEQTGNYEFDYRLFGSTLTYLQPDDTEWSGGEPAYEGISFEWPLDECEVYVSFVGAAGNIRSVNLYRDELIKENMTYYNGVNRMLTPEEYVSFGIDFKENAEVLKATDATLVHGVESGDEPHIDTSNNSWGWCKEGVIVDYGTIDFGDDGFAEIAIEFTHWSNDILFDWIDLYIDEVSEENKIAQYWTGIEVRDIFKIMGKSIDRSITGEHKILARWSGGSTNLRDIFFFKDQIHTTPLEAFRPYNYQPDEKATVIKFKEGADDYYSNTIMTSKNGEKIEDAGNLGWTTGGSVIRINDFDFSGFNGVYTNFIVNHSTPSDAGSYLDPKNYNFAFYVDLEEEVAPAAIAPRAAVEYTQDQWNNNLSDILAGHDPIAKVRMQATGDWGNYRRSEADIDPELLPVGVHDLYMVINGSGSNVLSIELEHTGTTGVENVAVESVSVRVADGCIIVDGEAAIYDLQGRTIATVAEAAKVAVAPGIYVVATADNTVKVAVK